MIQFLVALATFLVLHIVPARAGIKDSLVVRFGEKSYRTVYSILSLVLLGWVIMAALQAPRDLVWQAQSWQFNFAIALMPLSAAFLFAAWATPNPLSVAFSAKSFDPGNPGVVAITRHPVLWGFGLWGLAHIPANGDWVSLIFFGCMALFAFAGMKRIEAKKREHLGEDTYRELAAPTSLIPFGAIIAGCTSMPRNAKLWIRVLIGLLAYAGFLFYGHVWLFGADPLTFY